LVADGTETDNIEVVKRFYSAIGEYLASFGTDDDALADALTEDGAHRSAPLIEDAQNLIAADAVWETLWSAAPFRGPTGIIEYGTGFTEIFGEWSWTVDGFLEVGDTVIGEFTVATRGKTSGVRTEQKMWNLFDVTEGKITRYREFVDQDEARAAAGLRA
jgi:ketosteroid isomerase-like protein